MNGVYLHGLKLSVHSWELPSWPRPVLWSATSGALKLAIGSVYPDARVEIAFDAVAEGPVLNPMTGDLSYRGAKLECDIRGGSEHERHVYQHIVANVTEGLFRRTLQLFIERDALNRFRQHQRGYKTYDLNEEPNRLTMPILT